MSENESEDIIEKKIGYQNEAELRTDFRDYLKNPINKETAINYLYNSLVDEIIFGIVLEVHHEYKSTGFAIDGTPDDINDYSINDLHQTHIKKDVIFNCPNCTRLVAASKFATHLANCMGMGRNSLRIANKKIITRECNNYNNSYFISNDEDEEEQRFNEKRRKKPIQNNRSRNRKNGKS